MQGAKLTGRLTCDGVPVQGKSVSFIISASSPDIVELQPNPAITDQNGNYVTKLDVSQGVMETISIKAVATIDGALLLRLQKLRLIVGVKIPPSI